MTQGLPEALILVAPSAALAVDLIAPRSKTKPGQTAGYRYPLPACIVDGIPAAP